MKNSLNLNMKLKQQLRLSPQMIQSIGLLTLSNLDLLAHIEKELSENPLLESDEKGNTVEIDSNIMNDPDMPSYEWVDYLEDSSDLGVPRDNDREDSKRRFLEGGIAEEKETLYDHLQVQLRMALSDERLIAIGERVLGFINRDGYLTMAPDLIALDLSEPSEDVDRVIDIIKTFDPPGVGGRDLREVLLLELAAHTPKQPLAERIITDHLDLLSTKDYAKIAAVLNVGIDDVERSAAVIQTLEPFPGRAFDTTKVRYIVPDIRIDKKDGEWHVELIDDYLPALSISEKYSAALKQAPGEEHGKFVAEKLSSALALIYAIEQRRRTLYKTGKALVEHQQDFFEKGPEHLKPLLLRDVAGTIGMSESTVSRVSNSKYVETSWGIFPVKYFFSVPVKSASGTDSKQSVKEKLRRIIAETSDNLSDEKLKALLAEKGINIARRTVAKYRKELKILSSRDRR